jgi:hypothetical protein
MVEQTSRKKNGCLLIVVSHAICQKKGLGMGPEIPVEFPLPLSLLKPLAAGVKALSASRKRNGNPSAA